MYLQYDYSSFTSQASQSVRYIMAFVFLFVIVPRLILTGYKKISFENIVSCYIRIVFFYILTGYLLVALKLYEVLAILLVLLALYIRKYVSENNIANFLELLSVVQLKILNYADGLNSPLNALKKTYSKILKGIHTLFSLITSTPQAIVNNLLLTAVVAYSAWLRFYDAMLNAAPAMSDAYVTLAWMKYIDRRILFHDEIYPQGFHIYLSFIQKFSTIDPLYVLRYTGPLNGVLIALGLYFTISGLTKNKTAGIISAFLYGVCGNFMTLEWARQASTNSQEFAFVFILPSLYFLYKYIKENKKSDLITAGIGITITGLVHTLAFMLCGIGMGVILFIVLTEKNKINRWNTGLKIIITGILSVLISMTPIGLGLLLKKRANESAANYLASTANDILSPTLITSDYIALFAISVIFLFVLFNLFKWNKLSMEKFILLFSISTFTLHYMGGPITKSIMVSSRSGELWAIVSAASIGTGFYILTRIFKHAKNSSLIISLAGFAAVAFVVFSINPQHIAPYKMEWNSTVEQYLSISKNFRPTNWTIVSSQYESYDLALGKGYHNYVDSLLEKIDPEKDPKDSFGIDYGEDIFIYYEKVIFQLPQSNHIYDLLEEDYERRKLEREQLEQWIADYKKNNDNMTVYYEDEVLKVYHIKIKMDEEEKNKRIWGSGRV